MTQIDLCPEEDLPAPIVVRPRGNPAFPVRTEPGAYREIAECQQLVRETLRYLGTEVPVECSWMKSKQAHYKKHGLARRRDEVKMLDAGSGTVRYEQRQVFLVEFSRVVFEQCPVDYRVNTIIHEACHVADWVLHPRRSYRLDKQTEGHGPEWQALMRHCGVEPERFGRTDVVDMPIVSCPKCEQKHVVTPKVAAQMRRGFTMRCTKCYAEISAEHVRVPASLEAAVERSLRSQKTPIYKCPDCGTVTGIQKKFAQKLRAAPSEAFEPTSNGVRLKKYIAKCPNCRSGLDPNLIQG